MNYYTEIIPATLAEELKEKGMPMEVWQGWATPYISVMENSEYDWLDKELGNEPSKVEKRYSVPSYADVFDWLMSEKKHMIIVSRDDGRWRWCYFIGLTTDYTSYDDTYVTEGEDFDTWHEAANAAIEKALTLI